MDNDVTAWIEGAKTLSITTLGATLSTMTFRKMTLKSTMTLSRMTHTITTLSTMTLRKMTLKSMMTLSKIIRSKMTLSMMTQGMMMLDMMTLSKMTPA